MLPTREGIDRYPRTRGYYRRYPADGYRFPCRCRAGCLMPCDGVCGCAACKISQVDSGNRT